MKILPPYLRKKIIDSLAKVDHPGLPGSSIKIFVSESAGKTDAEIIQCVNEIKSQISSNGPALKRVLGSEFNFINGLHIPAKYSSSKYAGSSNQLLVNTSNR